MAIQWLHVPTLGYLVWSRILSHHYTLASIVNSSCHCAHAAAVLNINFGARVITQELCRQFMGIKLGFQQLSRPS